MFKDEKVTVASRTSPINHTHHPHPRHPTQDSLEGRLISPICFHGPFILPTKSTCGGDEAITRVPVAALLSASRGPGHHHSAPEPRGDHDVPWGRLPLPSRPPETEASVPRGTLTPPTHPTDRGVERNNARDLAARGARGAVCAARSILTAAPRMRAAHAPPSALAGPRPAARDRQRRATSRFLEEKRQRPPRARPRGVGDGGARSRREATTSI
jgi:hypothetical protein